jgi:hypothetical protein
VITWGKILKRASNYYSCLTRCPRLQRGSRLSSAFRAAHALLPAIRVYRLRGQCFCTVGGAAQVRMRARSATARCKDQIAADISCYCARVQQHHDCGLLLDRTGRVAAAGCWVCGMHCWVCGMHCWHTRASVWIATSFPLRPRAGHHRPLRHTPAHPERAGHGCGCGCGCVYVFVCMCVCVCVCVCVYFVCACVCDCCHVCRTSHVA